jgi:branched-chain amino acid transport system ATP-binding protein
VLKVTGLCAGYGDTEILHGIDIAAEGGDIIAVLGSNGAGKTTLNNVLSGILVPVSGNIRFDGEDVTGASAAELVSRGLIHVPEGRRVFPTLTVLENLELGSYRRGREHRVENLERIVAIFPHLRERLSQSAGTLSGGEQQMLAIGRGLMAEPKLLILDEPSLGLAPVLVDELFSLIRTINRQGLTILLVEQNVARSLEIASRAYVIEQGYIALSGSAAELAENEDVRRSYLGVT